MRHFALVVNLAHRDSTLAIPRFLPLVPFRPPPTFIPPRPRLTPSLPRRVLYLARDACAILSNSANVQDYYKDACFAPLSRRSRPLLNLHRAKGSHSNILPSPSPSVSTSPSLSSLRPRRHPPSLPRLRGLRTYFSSAPALTSSSPSPSFPSTSSPPSHFATMDRIPKFRRKPKNPTIETAIERSSSDTIESIASVEIQAVNAQQKQLQPQKPVAKPSKKSAFRNFRLRASAKRARESPPGELPSSPPPAIVSLEGIKSRPATADGIGMKNGHGVAPQIPAFLASTMQDIDFKFQELTWAERDRVLEGTKHEAEEGFKWGTYKQLDAEEKGVMDRYVNIKPWNHNRVRLQVPANELDYVNASDITLESPSDPGKVPLRYIAMQGPTPPSVGYVWRMIAEQLSSPAVIVQLTTMCEGGAIKCHQYFPDDEDQPTWDLNEQNAWGDDWKARLTLDSFEELCDGSIEKRKLLLQVEGEEKPRVVWHLLYQRWPDFGVPELEDLDGFFELMRLSLEHSAPSNPRIIHCSAGVGRTGTFITLEHLMRELESGAFEDYDTPILQGPDLIYETVNYLREQRVGMVQGKPQYHFLYQVMCKLWQDKYGLDEDSGEPAAKRLEVEDPFLDAGPGPDVGGVGIAR